MMDTLIAELEAATEGSRELSDKVALAIGWKNEIHGDEARGYFVPRYATWTSPEGVQQPPNEWWPPPVTQSLDAALTLVEEDAVWAVSCGDDYPGKFRATVMLLGPIQKTAHAPTPALALCIASLRTRQAMKENG